MRRFGRHYTPEEANALLPRIRTWLGRLRLLQPVFDEHARSLAPRLAQGLDLGGSRVHAWVRTWLLLRDLQAEFTSREIQVRDLDRGLIDFPSLRGDREVFLCWEDGEENVEFWHELEAGIAGRSPL